MGLHPSPFYRTPWRTDSLDQWTARHCSRTVGSVAGSCCTWEDTVHSAHTGDPGWADLDWEDPCSVWSFYTRLWRSDDDHGDTLRYYLDTFDTSTFVSLCKLLRILANFCNTSNELFFQNFLPHETALFWHLSGSSDCLRLKKTLVELPNTSDTLQVAGELVGNYETICTVCRKFVELNLSISTVRRFALDWPMSDEEARNKWKANVWRRFLEGDCWKAIAGRRMLEGECMVYQMGDRQANDQLSL